MKKILLILAASTALAGCGQTKEETIKNLTFEGYADLESDSAYKTLQFKDENNNEVDLCAHEVYERIFKEGVIYNVTIEKEGFNQPDNYITDVKTKNKSYLNLDLHIDKQS